MRNWIETEPVNVPTDFSEAIGGDPLIAKTLLRRGLDSIDSALGFLYPESYRPSEPRELPGLTTAVDFLEYAIRHHEKICVWGDFDVDGQTSTALFVSTLRDLGADVIHHIPVRSTESHGINTQILKKLISNGIRILLSCDTGINDHHSIEYAVKAGVKVIVTDHHDLPEILPVANAIVNPKTLQASHPLRTLPGVGVAFKVSEELYKRFGKSENICDHLDLVALGIVADLALQIKDTRYLLQRGLDVLRHTRKAGLLALMKITGITPENITEDHISYMLSPRLNALGRLTDASSGVEFLLTRSHDSASEMAIHLDKLNEERKLITQQVFQAALLQIESDRTILEQPVIVLEHPTWPIGVLGIVASRLVDYFHRPTILFMTPPNELARGSARSIEGINITAAIAAQKEYLESFGGHPMAGGLSIRPEMLPTFKHAINRSLNSLVNENSIVQELKIDGNQRLCDLSLEFVADLERLAPFGVGNPPLILVSRGMHLRGFTKIGQNEEHLLLTIEDNFGFNHQVIWWQGAGLPLPDREFDLAYSVRSSTYSGKKDIQVEWIDFRYTEAATVNLKDELSRIMLIDHRKANTPKATLAKLFQEEYIQVWSESDQPVGIKVCNRYELKSSNNLVIWTIPPGLQELQNALEITDPQKIYVFGIDPEMDDPEIYLKRLAGLLKYAQVYKNGITSIQALAAACAQRVHTTLEAVKWLQSHGYFEIKFRDDDIVVINEGSTATTNRINNTRLLRELLKESAAYRSYFRRASIDALINIQEN